MEVLINGSGSILLPSNIKFPRIEKRSTIVKERFHEPTSNRYIMMHSVILIENSILAIWSWNELPNDNNVAFITYYPYIVLGIFFLSMLCQLIYYQLHAWPLSATKCISFHIPYFTKNRVVDPDETLKPQPNGNEFDRLKGEQKVLYKLILREI